MHIHLVNVNLSGNFAVLVGFKFFFRDSFLDMFELPSDNGNGKVMSSLFVSKPGDILRFLITKFLIIGMFNISHYFCFVNRKEVCGLFFREDGNRTIIRHFYILKFPVLN